MIETNTAEGVEEECKETVRGTSAHSEVMRRMGYEPSLPVTKKTKTNWDMLVDEFPCPVHIQHSVWAARILRNLKKDCGYPRLDSLCDCTKCIVGIDFEQSEMSKYMEHPRNCRCSDPLDADTMLTGLASPCPILQIRPICSGVDGFLDAKERLEPMQSIPIATNTTTVNAVHLYLTETEVTQQYGPTTPFQTTLYMGEEDINALPPRTMWLRARSIDPTYLSFKNVV